MTGRKQALTYAPRALAWPVFPFFVLGAAGLTVDSLSPDALCPPLEETRAAVAARLGSVDLDGTWHATYQVVHRAQGDFVSLSLSDPSGATKLERDLPVQSGSCATLSRVIALVLERFFMRLEQASPVEEAPLEARRERDSSIEASFPTVSSSPATLAAPVAQRPTDSANTNRPAPNTPSPEPRHYDVSGALWASTDWVAPQLTFGRELSGPYRLGLSAAFDLARHESRVFEGAASVRRAPLVLSCDRRFPLALHVNLEASLELLGLLEAAKTRGLAMSGGGLRLVPGLGAGLGARFLTHAATQPFAQLTAAWLLRAAAPAFRVGTDEVLAPPALVLGLALGIGAPL